MSQAEKIRNAFHKLLRDNFRSGFDPASIIDRKKFGRAFCSLHNLESFDAEESDLKAEAIRSCLEWQAKFYAIDDKAWEQIKGLFKELRQNGTNLVNVEVLFKKFAPKFLELGIISADILKVYLRQQIGSPKLPNYLRLDSQKGIESEFAQKLAEVSYLPQKEIAELFPYLSAADATHWAERVLHFSTLRNGDIYLPSSVIFDDSELAREMTKIKKAITEQGYFFVSQLDLSKSRANCADFPDTLFITELEKKFEEANLVLNGKIISSRNDKKQLSKMIGAYCQNQEKFTLGDIQIMFGEHLPSSYSSWFNSICIRNAIQTDFDNFVSFKSVNFDIDAIDTAIDQIYERKLFTIVSFNKYDLLPIINDFEWNKYILQSYLLNFSKIFKFIPPAPNRKCIGIACHRNIESKNYHQLAAIMAITAGIPPNFERLASYLIREGVYANFVPGTVLRILKLMSN